MTTFHPRPSHNIEKQKYRSIVVRREKERVEDALRKTARGQRDRAVTDPAHVCWIATAPSSRAPSALPPYGLATAPAPSCGVVFAARGGQTRRSASGQARVTRSDDRVPQGAAGSDGPTRLGGDQ